MLWKGKFNKQNRTKKIASTTLVAWLFSAVFLVNFASAITVHYAANSEEIFAGDVFVVNLVVEEVDKSLNVAEMHLTFDTDLLEVVEVSRGGSVFDVWAEDPTFSNERGEIDFVGGTPSGFETDTQFMKLIFKAKQSGEATLDFKDTSALYLNDGHGTIAGSWVRPLTLSITERPEGIVPKDEWQEILNSDKTPPLEFEIILDKNPSVFGNQYYITFFTTDLETGIDRYEIQEGEESFISGDSPYLLKDQELHSIIRVKAVDKAGNERIAELSATAPKTLPFYQNLYFWLGVLVLLLVVYVIWTIRLKKRGASNLKRKYDREIRTK